jgi:hypothetical protein
VVVLPPLLSYFDAKTRLRAVVIVNQEEEQQPAVYKTTGYPTTNEPIDSYGALNGSDGKSDGSSIADSPHLPTNGSTDDELQVVVDAWPALPWLIRRAVLALVDSVTTVTGTETPANGHEKGGFGDSGVEGEA